MLSASEHFAEHFVIDDPEVFYIHVMKLQILDQALRSS